MISYDTTSTHDIDRLAVHVEVDDWQDTSHLLGQYDINAADPDERMAARADAIRLAQHGRTWGFVSIVIYSEPDHVVRASLGGVDAFDSNVYHRNERARANADAYLGETLSELADEARDAIHDQTTATPEETSTLPLVDDALGCPVDGAWLRTMASVAIDWWTRP